MSSELRISGLRAAQILNPEVSELGPACAQPSELRIYGLRFLIRRFSEVSSLETSPSKNL